MMKLIIRAVIALTLTTTVFADDLFTSKDYADRRATLAEKLGDNDVLIVFANHHDIYSEDVNYPYHPNGTLRYLTGATQDGTVYVMRKFDGKVDHRIYTKPRNILFEKWNGKSATEDAVRSITGIKDVRDSQYVDQELNRILYDMRKGATLWLERGNDPKREDHSPAQTLANKLRTDEFNKEIKTFRPLTQKMREIKSANEIEALKRATEITVAGHKAGMRRALTASHEYQVEAAIEAVYLDQGAETVGYPSIVGAERNATILHYETNREAIPRGSLILVDSAAEYRGYSSDVTRTFPSDGTFTDAQKDIYQIVYDAQEAAFALSKPNASFRDLTMASFGVIGEGLLKLGLITEKSQAQIGLYAYHGLGHGIGLNVHDPNPYGNLQPGAVYTVEPGVYVNKDFILTDKNFLALSAKDQASIKKALDKYDAIGVRIEDDLVITEDGYINLSVGAPRSIADVEAWMAGK